MGSLNHNLNTITITITMSSISLLLLIPLAVSTFPVFLVNQAESLKSILRVVDRDPPYAEAMARVGARAYRCIDDIDDAIDDAIDDDIDDAKDAFILSKVVTFLTKHRTTISNYNQNRFSNILVSSIVSPSMVTSLAQLCIDIGGRSPAVFRSPVPAVFRSPAPGVFRSPAVFRTKKTFRNKIVAPVNVNQKFLVPFLDRKKFLSGNTRFVTLNDTDESDFDDSDAEDSDFD